jgi:outer membrane lipoprotein-sorting protein
MKRAVLLAAVLALAMSGGAARGAADDFDELMRLLAARRHGEVSFVEQHFIAILKRPTESFGELVYDAPDKLEKRTLEPKAESLLVDGDVLTIRRGGSSRVLDLKAYPEVLPFVESIRATLAGDRAALERNFRVQFAGDLARWRLILVPLDGKAAKKIAQVSIDGMRDRLLTVEIKDTDGDRSLTTLRDHRPQ